MDALGRVTEGQSPRPDPNLAPAYLALMPLRASAVRVRRGAHHAHPQGMQGTPPERLHHRRSRRGRALSVNQPPRGIGSQSLSGTPTVGPRPGAGPGTGRCTWNARPLARLSESAPGRLSQIGVGRNAQARTRDLMVGRRWGRWGEVGGWAGSHIRARSGAPPSKLAPRCQRNPALGGELRVPMARLERMPAARAKAELPDGSLGRWTGAEGSGPRCPSLHR